MEVAEDLYTIEIAFIKQATSTPMAYTLLMVAPWVLMRLADVWASALLHLGKVYDTGAQYTDQGHACLWAFSLPALLMGKPGTAE